MALSSAILTRSDGSPVVVACSVAAAVCFALATVLQQRAAACVPDRHALRLGLLVRVVRQRRWLAGKVADTAALGLQALALSRGSLLVVQPLLTLGLVVALVLDAVAARRRPAVRTLAGALAITLGVTVFVLLGTGAGSDAGRAWAGLGAWLVGGALVGAAAVVCAAVAAGRGPAARGGLYAAAGGLTYALSGALVKQTTGLWRHHVGPVPLALALVGFVGVGLLGTLLVQTAFQVAPLAASIGVLTAMEPVAAGFVGVVVFGERVRHGAPAVIVAASAAVVTLWGILAVTRSEAAQPGQRSALREWRPA